MIFGTVLFWHIISRLLWEIHSSKTNQW